jgi:hypothetical protein
MTRNPFDVGRELLLNSDPAESQLPPPRTAPPEVVSAWAWDRFLTLGGIATPTNPAHRAANRRAWDQVERELEGNPASKTLPAFQRPPIERPDSVPKLCSRCASNDHVKACSSGVGCSSPVAAPPDDWVCLCHQEPDSASGRRGRA